MAAKYLVDNQGKLDNKVYTIPEELDQQIASIKLQSMGIGIDTLTDQIKALPEGFAVYSGSDNLTLDIDPTDVATHGQQQLILRVCEFDDAHAKFALLEQMCYNPDPITAALFNWPETGAGPL